MIKPYPPTDSRRTKKLVAELKRLAEVFLPALHDITTEDNVTHALVEIAARLAGQVTQRLDKVPRRDAIAFFSTLDVPQEAPRTARVPLIFTLSEKREKPVYIPARVQVAANGKDGEEVIFETRAALNLTSARLNYVAAVDTTPDQDHIEEPPPQFFQLAPPDEQINYLSVTAATQGSRILQISPAMGLKKDDIIGIDSSVYRVEEFKNGLVTLAEENPLEQIVEANTPIWKVTRFEAFTLRNLQQHVVYIGHAEALNLEQPSTIRLVVNPPTVASSLANLVGLTIELYGTDPAKVEKKTGWQPLSLISAGGGELLLHKDWVGTVDEYPVHGQKSRWLKLQLNQPINDAQPDNMRIAGFTLRVESGSDGTVQQAASPTNYCCDGGDQQPDEKKASVLCISCELGEQEGSQTIKQAFHNATPLPLSTRFFPFGMEPLRFDTFALAAPEALSKKGAKVALAINLVDATPAVLEMAIGASDNTKRVYAIGVNGRLQVLELPETGLLDTYKWQELGHPTKLPEENTGNQDLKKLRLDAALSPQATAVGGKDFVVVGDQGGRLWVTIVSKKTGEPDSFTHTEWLFIPSPDPNGARINDLVLSTRDSLVSGKVVTYVDLFAATERGLFFKIISPSDALPQYKNWRETLPEDENFKPVFGLAPETGSKTRLIPVLSPEWPSTLDVFQFGVVMLDALGVFWRGEFYGLRVTWKKLAAQQGDDEFPLGSPEVRPVAVFNDDGEDFALFAATKENRALFKLIGKGDELMRVNPYPVSKPQQEFIVQAETQLLCDPGFRLNEEGQPIVLAFGENDNDPPKIALWLKDDDFKELDYPPGRVSVGKTSGIFLPQSESQPPLIIINGGRETLYQTYQTPSVVSNSATLVLESVLDNWIAESFQRSEKNPELSWEYFNGDGWRRLDKDFNDTTNNLAVSGKLCFPVPDDMAPTEIFGKKDFWLRARLVGGDYGRAKYVVTTTTPDAAKPETTTQTITVDSSELRAPEIVAIEACFQMDNELQPEIVLTENNRDVLNQTQANDVDTAEFALFEGAAAIDADFKGNRALYLGFTKSYEVTPLTLYVDAEEPEGVENLLETVKLEFEILAQGRVWRKVAVDDLTNGFQRRGLIKLFIDVAPQLNRLFNRELFWMRVVPPEKKSKNWTPRLNGIYINAADAEQARSVKQEILGSSSGDPNQRFFLSKPPVISNSLVLRVREALSEDERLELEQAIKITLDTRQPEFRIVDMPVTETYQDIPGDWVLWRQTDSFAGCDGDARVYQLDPISGEVRFGNNKQGKIPPAGKDVVRAIDYQNGGGEAGNVAAFTIEGLKSSVESVDSVTNPIPAAGGVDVPDIDIQIVTAPDRLRHRQQALTPLDIEALAVSWSSEIVNARCLSPLEPNDPIKVYIARRTGERSPKATLVERDALARYLLDQGWGALDDGDIRVYNPDYVRVFVAIDIIAESSETVAAVEKEAKEKLLKLLHPITGGPDGTGWPFGRSLWKSDLFRALDGIPGISWVKDINFLKPDLLSPSSLINLVFPAA